MAAPDQIPTFKKGDVLKARDVNAIAALAKMGYSITGGNWIRTSNGIHFREKPKSATAHWGTLDDDLAYNDTTGVTVTLDEGGTVDNVLPPKGMSEGTFPEDAHVFIVFAGGEWRVIYCSECAA